MDAASKTKTHHDRRVVPVLGGCRHAEALKYDARRSCGMPSLSNSFFLKTD
jgi:hypothetical protein